MALVIEDGSVVADANSYVTVAEIRAYGLLRGLTLPAVDADVEVLAIRAMDHIENSNIKFKGVRYSESQELTFPRNAVYIDGVLAALVPKLLKDAQCQLASDANTTADFKPVGIGRETIKEKVGPIETAFSPQGTNSVKPVMNKFKDMIKPLIIGGGALRAVRV